MANKSLNNSLDAHFSKVKGGTIKTPRKKVERKQYLKHIWKSFLSGLKTIKNYFFPSPSYEQATFSGQGIAVVAAFDNGIKKHVKMFLNIFKKKKRTTKAVIEEKPDIDMSTVNKVIKNNRL
jgi:hypothetical protein